MSPFNCVRWQDSREYHGGVIITWRLCGDEKFCLAEFHIKFCHFVHAAIVLQVIWFRNQNWIYVSVQYHMKTRWLWSAIRQFTSEFRFESTNTVYCTCIYNVYIKIDTMFANLRDISSAHDFWREMNILIKLPIKNKKQREKYISFNLVSDFLYRVMIVIFISLRRK